MVEEKDPLDDLFVSEDTAVNNELLKEMLIDYIQMTKEGKIFPLPMFNREKSEKKILLYLLSKKVLSLKLEDVDEKTSPKEIQGFTGLPKGTVNPALRGLAGKRLVTAHSGKYYVPNFAVSQIKEEYWNE